MIEGRARSVRTRAWTSLLARAALVSLAAGLVATGCRDSGLPGRNTPVEEAMQAPPLYPVYESTGSARAGDLGVYTVAGGRYLPSAAAERIPPRVVRPIGIAGGQQIVVLSWDEEPYDRLYLATADGRYQPLLRLP